MHNSKGIERRTLNTKEFWDICREQIILWKQKHLLFYNLCTLSEMYIYIYVTQDHKTSHKGKSFKNEFYTASES